MYYNSGFFMGGMHFPWWMFWLVLLGIIIFYGWTRTSERCRRPHEPLHEVLQRHLANGEITPREYEERKGLLDRDVSSRE